MSFCTVDGRSWPPITPRARSGKKPVRPGMTTGIAIVRQISNLSHRLDHAPGCQTARRGWPPRVALTAAERSAGRMPPLRLVARCSTSSAARAGAGRFCQPRVTSKVGITPAIGARISGDHSTAWLRPKLPPVACRRENAGRWTARPEGSPRAVWGGQSSSPPAYRLVRRSFWLAGRAGRPDVPKPRRLAACAEEGDVRCR